MHPRTPGSPLSEASAAAHSRQVLRFSPWVFLNTHLALIFNTCSSYMSTWEQPSVLLTWEVFIFGMPVPQRHTDGEGEESVRGRMGVLPHRPALRGQCKTPSLGPSPSPRKEAHTSPQCPWRTPLQGGYVPWGACQPEAEAPSGADLEAQEGAGAAGAERARGVWLDPRRRAGEEPCWRAHHPFGGSGIWPRGISPEVSRPKGRVWGSLRPFLYMTAEYLTINKKAVSAQGILQ